MRKRLAPLPIVLVGALGAACAVAEDGSASAVTAAVTAPTYTNPELGTGADPGVIRVGSKFLLVTTSGSSRDAIPVRVSTDLVHWTAVGPILPRAQWPAWVKGDFWAPEIHRVGERHAVFFTARSTKTDKPSVGVAWTSDLEAWAHGNTRWENVRWTSPATPLASDERTIDPAQEDRPGFIDPTYLAFEGRHYLYFNKDLWTNKPGNGQWRHEGELYAQELTVGRTDAYVTVKEGATRATVLRIDKDWEGDVLEGAYPFVRDGVIYLLYSANRYWEGKYCVGVARSSSPGGGFEKRDQPVLRSNAAFVGPGHGSFVNNGGADYFVYHAYRAGEVGDKFPRLLMLDQVTWTGGWPLVNGTGAEPGTPSSGPMLVPVSR